MSIESRLRDGLQANTDSLLPQVDHELGAVLRRAHRRHRARLAVAGVAAAAAFAGWGWLLGSGGVDRGQAPPSNDGDRTAGPVAMAGYNGPLEPGTYLVPTWGHGDEEGDTWPLAVVDVPAGYWSPGGWVVDAGHGELEPDDYGELMFFHADRIVRDPCANLTTAAPLGPTAQDLATALQRQPGQHTSTPRPVSIGGHDGLHLRVMLPEDTDLTACDGMQHALWEWGDDRFALNPDADVAHLWILDVDGKRIIMVAQLYPDQKPGQNAELLAMARNVHFMDPAD